MMCSDELIQIGLSWSQPSAFVFGFVFLPRKLCIYHRRGVGTPKMLNAHLLLRALFTLGDTKDCISSNNCCCSNTFVHAIVSVKALTQDIFKWIVSALSGIDVQVITLSHTPRLISVLNGTSTNAFFFFQHAYLDSWKKRWHAYFMLKAVCMLYSQRSLIYIWIKQCVPIL